MPSTLKGTGTKHQGKREVGIGGTCIATTWMTVFWLPILPLSSWRDLALKTAADLSAVRWGPDAVAFSPPAA